MSLTKKIQVIDDLFESGVERGNLAKEAMRHRFTEAVKVDLYILLLEDPNREAEDKEFSESLGCEYTTIRESIANSEFDEDYLTFFDVTEFRNTEPDELMGVLPIQKDADLYLIDGLNGRWNKIASLLPKDKVLLVSYGTDNVHSARDMGYKAIDDAHDSVYHKREAIEQMFGEE